MLATLMSGDCLNTRSRTTDTPVGFKGEKRQRIKMSACYKQERGVLE